MKKTFAYILLIVFILFAMTGCTGADGSDKDTRSTRVTVASLQEKQPTPTDIEYSLERYNLIRRAYWVNGQREKANSLVCEVSKPLGYVILLIDGVGVVDRFIVDGKVSSLNSYLTPDSEYYSREGYKIRWLADIDGSYGENDNGIFFFTPEGNYIEWTGVYLYSDIPFEVSDPIIKYEEVG